MCGTAAATLEICFFYRKVMRSVSGGKVEPGYSARRKGRRCKHTKVYSFKQKACGMCLIERKKFEGDSGRTALS